MTPSHSDFLRAIIAAPADDLPRLAYADWLEESGEPERAEFIRVQCEIAELEETDWREEAVAGKWGKGDDVLEKRGAHIHALRHRERQLLGFGPGGHTPDHKLNWYQWVGVARETIERRDVQGQVLRMFRRGFIDEIHLTLSQFFGGVLGPQIFRDHPVERVVITDREPFRWGNGWAWQSRLLHGPANSLLPESVIMADTIWYRSYDDAVDGASYLCCRWARAEADKLEAVGV